MKFKFIACHKTNFFNKILSSSKVLSQLLGQVLITLIFILLFFSCNKKDKSILIFDGYIREAVKEQINTSGYVKITNNSENEINLISIVSDISESIELHEMSMENEMMKMRKLDKITLPPVSSIELKPGGLHIMFMGLMKDLKEGEEVKLNLIFEKEGKKEVLFKVKKIQL